MPPSVEGVRLVRIPRGLLHVSFEDLAGLGVTDAMRDRVRGLLADLPLLPSAEHSAQIVGAPELTLACLAVVARHVGQGLRDHNLSMAHDRARLKEERRKLVFLDAATLAQLVASGDPRPAREAVLFVTDAGGQVLAVLRERERRGFASFVACQQPLDDFAHWRLV